MISPGASRVSTPGPSGHITNEEDEPLDWGSDNEKYTSLSFYTHFANSMTASHHLLRGLKDGGFNDVVLREVNKLYNVSFGVLDVSTISFSISVLSVMKRLVPCGS